MIGGIGGVIGWCEGREGGVEVVPEARNGLEETGGAADNILAPV